MHRLVRLLEFLILQTVKGAITILFGTPITINLEVQTHKNHYFTPLMTSAIKNGGSAEAAVLEISLELKEKMRVSHWKESGHKRHPS